MMHAAGRMQPMRLLSNKACLALAEKSRRAKPNSPDFYLRKLRAVPKLFSYVTSTTYNETSLMTGQAVSKNGQGALGCSNDMEVILSTSRSLGTLLYCNISPSVTVRLWFGFG